MLALAALSVRRGETNKAVDYCLRVLEDRPKDRKARSFLSVLRTEGGPEGIAKLLETGRIERLYPGGRAIPRFIVPSALVLVVLVAIYFAWPPAVSFIEAAARPRVARPEVAAVTLSRAEKDSPVQTGGTFRYVLTEEEALRSFEKAKDYFQAYRDNAAVIEINRLLGSNASAALKEKARTLRAFVGKPDFRTIRDAPDYAQAMTDPGLYDGTSVDWKGMAANVRSDGGSVTFDFLVGYQDKKKLEGLIKARISGAEVPVDRPLEILATLRMAVGGLGLDCAAIHELSAGQAQ